MSLLAVGSLTHGRRLATAAARTMAAVPASMTRLVVTGAAAPAPAATVQSRLVAAPTPIPQRKGVAVRSSIGPNALRFAAHALDRTSLSQRRRPCTTTAQAQAAEAPPKEEFEYQAEVSRLMDLIVNSLYSNKDVFLRELVSNASDALDKMRFLSVTNQAALGELADLEIKIKADPEAQTLTITDSGIGMTREELVDSLGTIARSGTAKFVEMVKQSKGADAESNLIGRFGVGFYSAFLVADRVTVKTRSYKDEKTHVWESSIKSSKYTITEEEGASGLARGTEITLHLTDENKELLDDKRISGLIKQYSEFISFPIKVWSSTVEYKQVPDETAEPEEVDGEKKPKMKSVPETTWDWKVENVNKPVWMRSPKEVTKDEYNSFFKSAFREFVDPLGHTHFVAEGEIEFRCILFVPGMPPFQDDMMARNRNLKLYVKRVFISDEFEDLMPRYLNFIKGVLDSSDLPLNVSREILQESRVVSIMRKRLVKKSLDLLEEIAERENKEDYTTLWESFGRNIKLGVIEDGANRETIAGLLRFYTSKSKETFVSLDDYISRMKEGQKSIYYLAADSMESAEKAPFMEALVKKGYEVMFLLEPIDEVAINNLARYKDNDLVDITKEGLTLPEESSAEEKEAQEKAEKEMEMLSKWLLSTLKDKIVKVTVSNRITDSPCVLVTSKFGWSANMERIMRAQAMADNKSMEYMKGQKILEINPSHPIILSLNQRVIGNPADKQAADLATLLYDTALLNSGFQLESSKDFANRVVDMMSIALAQPAAAAPAAAADAPVDPEVV